MYELLDHLLLIAQEGASTGGGEAGLGDTLVRPLVLAIVFSALGIILLVGGFFILTKLLPFSLRKEIEEDQNTSLAILISAFVLGISLIIAASIVG